MPVKRFRPNIETVEQLLEKDPEDLVREYQRTVNEIKELKEYQVTLGETIGRLAEKQPGDILKTDYGNYKCFIRRSYRGWNIEGLESVLYQKVIEGTLYSELDSVERLRKVYGQAFKFVPQPIKIRELGLDVEDYCEVAGEKYYSVGRMKEYR